VAQGGMLKRLYQSVLYSERAPLAQSDYERVLEVHERVPDKVEREPK
jgi:hypothetical protein